MQEQSISLKDLIHIINKRFRIMYVITLVIVLITTVINLFFISPVYEVKTMVFVGKSPSNNESYTSNDIEMYKNLIQTYIKLINTNDLVENALTENNIQIESSKVIDNLDVSQSADSQIIQIIYRDNDKYLAKNIVEDITLEFIRDVNELIPNGSVEIIEHAQLPKDYVKPHKINNIIISFIAGIFASLSIVLLWEIMNRSLKTKGYIEDVIETRNT